MKSYLKIGQLILLIFISAFALSAQTVEREFPYKTGATLEIKNLYGRVWIQTDEALKEKAFVQINSDNSLAESEMRIDNASNLTIEIVPQNPKNRVDLTIKLPVRSRVRVTTGEGEVRVSGDLESAEAVSDTGTISAQVPLDNLKYNFLWTASRPRYVSDPALEEIKEKAAGRFVLKGKISQVSRVESRESEEEKSSETEETPTNENTTENAETTDKKSKEKKKKSKSKTQSSKTVSLDFTTARGIILLNVNPSEVPSDLRDRPLTAAAKAIIRSGDSLLMEAIRRASPKYFGDYAATLPPLKKSPTLTQAEKNQDLSAAQVKKVLVKVTDINNRAVSDLKKADFEVQESGEAREVLSVESTTAPFNLVLLLDVSGSVENYVDFIRKAARNFVNTVGRDDRIAIIIFNEDVKNISTFTTDKGKLSESLDTFDAGGGTAYYDALAYTLVETLKPLRGDRTAIVALTDGDDNRSFLSFDSLLGSIQESGALVYPLYVPSDLIAASANNNPDSSIDPLRTRYMSLTSKAEAEGERLAQISGGVYYSIKQLSELQKAYNDIVVQLRTAYTVTFRSDAKETRGDGAISPRLKVKVKRPNSFVKLGSVVEVSK
jgi:VWFA-related protein